MAFAPLMEVEIMTKIKGKNDAITFAAIKMVEQLFHDGQIPANTLIALILQNSDVAMKKRKIKMRCRHDVRFEKGV